MTEPLERISEVTPDQTNRNIEKIEVLFPSCITESNDEDGKPRKAINFELLQQLLSPNIVSGKEAYEFTWVGKKAAILEANTPIKKTLRPVVELSQDWSNTSNLYIEGDNLEALKLLQESYLQKVNIIYIDPPYNTGNDFVYKDNFVKSADDYEEEQGLYSETGEKLFKNTDTNGRFHSDWCSMMYSRLMLARRFLSDDGVIFISIDDHEQQNMKNMCNEVFGEKNFIAQIVWERAFSPINLKKHFSESHDYILCYAKHIEKAVCNGLPRTEEANNRYSNPDNDPRGVWQSDNLSVGPAIEKNIYEITTPGGRRVSPPSGYSWRLSKERFESYVKDNRIYFGQDGNNVPRIKRFLSELEKKGMTPMTIWRHQDVGHSQGAKQELKKIFDNKSYFDYPKPVSLIKRCIQLYGDKNCTVMDFFSGTATTAQAVMEANIEDRGRRNFILIQLPESIDKKNPAYKDGFRTICEIGRKRIIRVGQKLKADNPHLDTGFRVFSVDSSNLIDFKLTPGLFSQDDLPDQMINIKEGRTPLDLLFGCILNWGVPLTLPYSSWTIGKHQIHDYNDGDLIACFDEHIAKEAIESMARRKPLRAAFRDSSFESSADRINVSSIFKLLSPNTKLKVI